MPLPYGSVLSKEQLADGLLDSRREIMANLTTVLTLLFGTEATLLTAVVLP